MLKLSEKIIANKVLISANKDFNLQCLPWQVIFLCCGLFNNKGVFFCSEHTSVFLISTMCWQVNGREVGQDPRVIQEELQAANGIIVLKILPSYHEAIPPRQVTDIPHSRLHHIFTRPELSIQSMQCIKTTLVLETCADYLPVSRSSSNVTTTTTRPMTT